MCENFFAPCRCKSKVSCADEGVQRTGAGKEPGVLPAEAGLGDGEEDVGIFAPGAPAAAAGRIAATS